LNIVFISLLPLPHWLLF